MRESLLKKKTEVVSGQLPPRKIAPRLELGFVKGRVRFRVGRGGNQTIALGKD